MTSMDDDMQLRVTEKRKAEPSEDIEHALESRCIALCVENRYRCAPEDKNVHQCRLRPSVLRTVRCSSSASARQSPRRRRTCSTEGEERAGFRAVVGGSFDQRPDASAGIAQDVTLELTHFALVGTLLLRRRVRAGLLRRRSCRVGVFGERGGRGRTFAAVLLRSRRKRQS